MTLAIAVLMKAPAESKSRLQPVLDPALREGLALLMFRNTLDRLSGWGIADHLAVVTPSERIMGLARELGAEAVLEAEGDGINGAAGRAAEWARGLGAEALLVLHADIPVLERAEVEQMLSAGRTHAVVIAESTDGGSNGVLLSPPDAIPFRFGRGSAGLHAVAAQGAGRGCLRLNLPGLSRDLDTPDDLHARFALPGNRLQEDTPRFLAFALGGLPEIAPGDDLGALIEVALAGAGERLQANDIVVVAQKIVSKSEGRMRTMAEYAPSPRALEIAAVTGKDPRKVEAVLQESTEVIRAVSAPPEGILITRHRNGWICANAGIDESNLGEGAEGRLLLLPEDADKSARAIRATLERSHGGPVGVIVTDTFGRPWRHGLVNIAIGTAGVPAVVDMAGRTDAYGRPLHVTVPALADEIAACAGLLMQKDRGCPVVVVRGLDWVADPKASARDVVREKSKELFL